MLKRLGKRAQTTAEYAVLIALVVGAVVAMQIYIKRGLQGRIRNVVDDTTVGGQVNNGGILTGEQYEPYYASSTGSTNQTVSDSGNVGAGGTESKTSQTTTTVNRDQTVGW